MKKLLYTVFIFLFAIVTSQAQTDDEKAARTRTANQETVQNQDASSSTSASEKARVEKVLAQKRADYEARKKAGEPLLPTTKDANNKVVKEDSKKARKNAKNSKKKN